MRQIVILVLLISGSLLSAQGNSNDVSLLATYGNMSGVNCVDNDFSQTVFFVIPENFKNEFFLRVMDPDCGGAYDVSKGLWETNTLFEVFGGENCLSEYDARQTKPEGNYKSGTILGRALFAKESVLDGSWISFGPFKTEQGEKLKEYPGYCFFKLIVEGRTGDDANLYSLFVSSSMESNKAISNVLFFEYERTFLKGEDITVDRIDEELLSTNEVPLPIKLNLLPEDPEYSISAEPLKE